MDLDYRIKTAHPDKLRTLHLIIIDGEILSTTRANEIRQFAKNRSISKYDWRQLKEAIRLGTSLKIRGGI